MSVFITNWLTFKIIKLEHKGYIKKWISPFHLSDLPKYLEMKFETIENSDTVEKVN